MQPVKLNDRHFPWDEKFVAAIEGALHEAAVFLAENSPQGNSSDSSLALVKRGFAGVVITGLAGRDQSWDTFQNKIICKAWVGAIPNEVTRNYLKNAEHKAWTSFRTGLSNEVVLGKAEATDPLDSLWAGTNVQNDKPFWNFRHRLAVSVSALEEFQDVLIAQRIMSSIETRVALAERKPIVPNISLIYSERQNGIDTFGGASFNLDSPTDPRTLR